MTGKMIFWLAMLVALPTALLARDLHAIAKRHGLKIIDDCCEALGAEYRGRKLGGFGAAELIDRGRGQAGRGIGGSLLERDRRRDKLRRIENASLDHCQQRRVDVRLHPVAANDFELSGNNRGLGMSEIRRDREAPPSTWRRNGSSHDAS